LHPSNAIDSSRRVARRLAVGAETDDNGTDFRIWAPTHKQVAVAFEDGREQALTPENNGYFSGYIPGAIAGQRYRIRLDGVAKPLPDPASRFQPEGPHGISEIVDSGRFQWNDSEWPGIKLKGQILYEMHVGTFTEEGTWRAAAKKLPHLKTLGITCIEMMPVAEFSGEFGWGYDGVDQFAPYHNYGSPDDLRAFIAAAHAQGLGVILDVVYNHCGPDGCYLKEFAKEYFTAKYENEWGEALNFDDDHSEGMRDLVLANVRYWIEEFHFDGLRIDAVQTIHDSSSRHIVSCITETAHASAGKKQIVVIAESENQKAIVARPISAGGFGVDAVWNDDFHHSALVAMTGHNGAYYSDHTGAPQEFVSAAKYGYLFQGQVYAWQGRRRGTPVRDLDASQFVLFLENHDQVANSAAGLRLAALTSPGRLRAFTALVLLLPGTPMLFQGQEFQSSKHFLYFADLPDSLRSDVERGRAKFLAQFPNIPAKLDQSPCDPSTFLQCKLDWAESQSHPEAVALHRDLLALRRSDSVFSAQASQGLDGAVLGPEAFVLRFFGTDGDDRLLFVNYGPDINRASFAEPLLAPPLERQWRPLWSSEEKKYGGSGVAPFEDKKGWHITGQSAFVLRA